MRIQKELLPIYADVVAYAHTTRQEKELEKKIGNCVPAFTVCSCAKRFVKRTRKCKSYETVCT